MSSLRAQWKTNTSQTTILDGGQWQGGQRKDLHGETVSLSKEDSNTNDDHASISSSEQKSQSNGDRPTVVATRIDACQGRLVVDPVCFTNSSQTDENFTERDDDAGVFSGTSGQESAVGSNKSFWLNLLTDQQDEQSGSDDDYDDDDDDDEDNDGLEKDNEQVCKPSWLARKSILGREIEQAWSNGSPLSESSAFENSVQNHASKLPTSFADYKEETLILSRSRRLSTIQQWESTPLSATGAENTVRGKSETQLAPNNPEAIQQSKNDITTSRRSFGDVTNRFNALPSTTPPVMPSGVSDGRSDLRSSWRHQPIYDARKIGQFIEKNTQEIEGTTPVRPSKTTYSSFASSKNAVPITTAAPKSYGSSDPLKIAVPTTSFAWKSGRRSKLEKVSPNLDDQRRFQWAYTSWQAAGLMKKVDVKSTEVGQSIGVDVPAHQEYPSDSEEGRATEISSSDITSNRQSPAHEQVFPAEGIDPVPSNDSEHSSGFRNLLNMWRNQSKSQLLPISASDRDEVRSFDSSSFSEHEELGAVSNSRQTDLAGKFPVPQSSVDVFVYETNVRQEDTNTSPNKTDSRFQEVSALSGISSELVPSNTGSNQDVSPRPRHNMKSEAFLSGSDLFEWQHLSQKGESSRALIILQDRNQYEVLVGETEQVGADAMVVRNLGLVAGSHENQLMDYEKCECSRSIFSGNDDLISFFLPQMGMACSCGRQRTGLLNPDDPTAIENILRPWQVEFLKSFGIHSGEQLVKARHRSADIMARALRQWRKKHDMIPFKTTSCGMAIHIWAKTCKAYVRSIRKQVLSGNDLLERQPGALLSELSLFLDGLPAAPKRKGVSPLCSIELDSQMEV